MSLRLLTSGEIALARTIFEDTINYAKVWIHNGSYFPFGLQCPLTAMTPSGEMYYPDDVYSPDYSVTANPTDRDNTIATSHLFMHEMTHVWQYQKGYNVKLNGVFSWLANYSYDLDGSSLMFYPMEQQAAIIADFWLLRYHRFDDALNNVFYKGNKGEAAKTHLLKYKRVLGTFPRCML